MKEEKDRGVRKTGEERGQRRKGNIASGNAAHYLVVTLTMCSVDHPQQYLSRLSQERNGRDMYVARAREYDGERYLLKLRYSYVLRDMKPIYRHVGE